MHRKPAQTGTNRHKLQLYNRQSSMETKSNQIKMTQIESIDNQIKAIKQG